MRLEKEGKDTSKMWMVGGVVGAIALAAGAAYFAGAPREPAPEGGSAPAATSAANSATNTAAPTDEHAGHAHATGEHGKEAAPVEGAGAATPNATPKKGAVAVTGGKPGAKAGATKAVKTVMIEGMKVEDFKIGTGKEAKSGDTLSMDYRGTLEDGSVFDESYKRGEPFEFPLGAGRVIQGWDKGVVGMKEGGKRRLTIPGELAYGANSPSPEIPANATLIFDIELRKVG